jgi:hypothetical protein
MWTGAEVTTNFLANTRGKFVVDVGGQLAKDTQAPHFAMSMSVSSC